MQQVAASASSTTRGLALGSRLADLEASGTRGGDFGRQRRHGSLFSGFD